ncbi:E3 ubiquitin-protein ligase TRIM71-like isoform X3 [Pomacea canaliculata]|uniref:E3 ubiquitin-protein ligase TRIM71-like isoform X3 n=1 Tax=Pomacea canaliculata TaxID=400727 RepID=UPI000D728AFB|nr:E3 ubiquitin-protein ligase TRIM71-like isoform X3 [Pomacea canaliculata]
MMQALVESARVLAKDPVSCACEDVAADSICVECLDMLCLSCCRAHKKTTVSRHHNVESLSTVTPERLAASRPALCADHGDKQAEFFCIDHRRAVCASCCIIKHRECSEVREMNDEIALAENSLKVLTIRLVNGEQRLERAIAQLEARVRDDYLSELEDIKQANIACDRLQKLVEATRDKIKQTIGSLHFRAMKSLLSVKGSLCTQLSKLKAHKQVAMRATTVAVRPSLIYANEALTDRVNNLDLDVDFEVDVSTNPSMNIRGCEELVRWVEKELAMMGQQTKAPEVRVDKTDRKWKKMLYGVAGLHPSNLSIQQQILEMADSIIIKEFGLLTTAEGNVKEGSVIGMTVDSSNNLHLYFDGKEVGVTAQNVPRPCYAVFDLCNQVVKVTALPVVKLETGRPESREMSWKIVKEK